MTRVKTLAAALLAVAAFGASAAGAFAAPTYQTAAHPRRAEVAHRLKVEHVRIDKARREGRISVRRARFLHHKERMIRQEARTEAHQNGGMLTKAAQHRLNVKENHLSKAIYR